MLHKATRLPLPLAALALALTLALTLAHARPPAPGRSPRALPTPCGRGPTCCSPWSATPICLLKGS